MKHKTHNCLKIEWAGGMEMVEMLVGRTEEERGSDSKGRWALSVASHSLSVGNVFLFLNSLMGFAYLSLSIIEQSLAKNIERFFWSGTIVGSGIWQTAGQTMWASG